MARLHEYQGKQLLAQQGLVIPRGRVAVSATDARAAAAALGGSVVVKAQVWAGGRGRAGGIRFADDPDAAAAEASRLLGSEIRGIPVTKVLVEERLNVVQELYVGVMIDTSENVRAPVVLVGGRGGIGVEDDADAPMAQTTVDVLTGLQADQVNEMVARAGLHGSLAIDVAEVVLVLYRVFEQYDCRSIEINPLVVTEGGRLVAADCRAAIDDSSVFRHPELGIPVARDSEREPTAFDRLAWWIEEGDLRGTGYVAQMDQKIEAVATIGYHGIGGGGAILGVDALNRAGLAVANYADTSGNPPASKVYRVAKLVLSQPGIAGYCLGGFMMANQEQWHHAHGIVKALREELPQRPGFPVVILLCGNKEEEALEILRRGLTDVPGRIEVYGRAHVYDTDFVAGRMRALVDQYLAEEGR